MALNNAQYDEIIRQYNAKQIRNQHIVEDRKNEVYAKNARLKEIDDTISSCSVAQAKKLLLGDDAAALDELKKTDCFSPRGKIRDLSFPRLPGGLLYSSL